MDRRMSRRRKVYEGKAKVLFEGPEPGTLIQYFKDDATAFNNQKQGVITGKGVLNNRISEHLMLRLAAIGIPTHFMRRLNMREQLIKEVEIIPLEVVVRNVVAGSLAQRLGIDQNESDAGAFVAAIGPGVIGTALDHDVALPQLHRRIVHVHLDLAFDHDDVVDGLGAVHVRVIAWREVDHRKARAFRRRRGSENACAHVLDLFADRHCRGRAVGAPHHGGDETGLRELGVGRRGVDQDLGDIAGVMARHHAADRRIIRLVHGFLPPHGCVIN